MLKIHLEGHDNYYGIADVVRAFYIHPVEDKENVRVVHFVKNEKTGKTYLKI